MQVKIIKILTLLFFWFSSEVLCQEKEVTTASIILANTIENSTRIKENTLTTTVKYAENSIKAKLICPGKEVSRPFFAARCKFTKECRELGGKNTLCCQNRCIKGIPALEPEPSHSPTLFGLVERVCPVELIPELLVVKQCKTDADCSPRICCPEKMLNGETVGYCRTAEPKLDRIPGIKPFIEPMKLMMSYMQCTPPPPPFLDLFPKPCNNPLDCFPNLCCQERGKKYCRPPRRSLLTLMTTVAQRIVPSEIARDFITRITA